MSIDSFTNKPKAYGDKGSLWKATLKDPGKAGEAIQLRKTFQGCSVLIIVGNDGWNYKNEVADPNKRVRAYGYYHDTTGMNVRVSMNGALMGDWNILDEIQSVISEAKELLEIQDKDERMSYILLKFDYEK